MKSPPESCPRDDGVSAGESAAARAVIERPRRVRTARRALCALSRVPRAPRLPHPARHHCPAPRARASLTHQRAGKFYITLDDTVMTYDVNETIEKIYYSSMK